MICLEAQRMPGLERVWEGWGSLGAGNGAQKGVERFGRLGGSGTCGQWGRQLTDEALSRR